MCVLSGKNDCGKSNVLKAINLFFNNETDWQTPLGFSKDFSRRRINEVRKDTIKGKQFIRVKLHFVRGKRYETSLPAKFYVMKTWYRDSSYPEMKSSIPSQFKNNMIKTASLDRALAGLQKYLNRIRFEYIPAVKDRSFFIYSLGLLQDTILQKKSGESRIEESVKSLNEAVEEGASKLNNEFESVCGVKTDIKLPDELSILFRAFSVATKIGSEDMPLNMRGDGIQARFLPSLLYYVATNSNLTYLWGFEEPENCLEHSLATDLAHELLITYTQNSQIFLTSHSSAFVSLEDKMASVYRVYSDEKGTNIISIHPIDRSSASNTLYDLKEELGLLQLSREQQNEFKRRKAELVVEKNQLIQLREEINVSNSPIFLTEGKSDPIILTEAWNRLFPDRQADFRINTCDPLDDTSGSAGGAHMLRKALESWRPDEPFAVGLFDRDQEGINAFENLDRNFIETAEDKLIKIHKNKTVAAFLIPDIDGKQDYIEAKNLPIEFVFHDDYIEKKNAEGYGLELRQESRVTYIGPLKIPNGETTEPHYRKIGANKVLFAEEIVPTFPVAAFDDFEIIFIIFKRILGILQSY